MKKSFKMILFLITFGIFIGVCLSLGRVFLLNKNQTVRNSQIYIRNRYKSSFQRRKIKGWL